MKRLFIIILITVVTLSNILPVEGHHYIYFAEDPERQMGDWQGIENSVFVKWATDGSALKYYVLQEGIKEDVAAVFSNWYAAITLPYQETTNIGEADLFFAELVDPCGRTDWDACFNPYDFTYREPQKASYTAKAQIHIRQGITFRRAAIAHELGHLYGLHERYIDQPTVASNPSELSVMDRSFDDLQEGPTIVDKTRVRAFWGKSDYVYEGNGVYYLWKKGDLSITATTYWDYSISKYKAAFTWRDLAWTEQVHQMGAYWGYEDTSENPPVIVWDTTPFLTKTYLENIGLHLFLGGDKTDLGDTYMEDIIIPRDFKPAGYFRMCGSPYFVGVQEWGSFRCSNSVYVP